MDRSIHRPHSGSRARGRTLAAIVGAAALFGALLSPTVAFAADPVDAIISGTISASGSGTGLEGVTITAENLADGETFDGYSEADGSYLITDLPAGQYIVSFRAPEDTDYISEWFSNAHSSEDATTVTLAESEERVLDAGLALGGKVSGTVRGTANVLLSDVLVEAYPFGGGPLLASASTDETGTYALRGLPSTGVTISFTDDADRGYVTEWSNNRADEESADKIIVAAGGAVVVDSALVTGASIAGTVTGAGTPVVPLADATVTIVDSSGEYAGDSTTDALGNFTVAGLPAGTYSMSFDAPEGSLYSGEWWQNQPDFESSTPIVIAAGAALTGYKATLASAGAISGTVTGSDRPGVGIEGVDVIAFTEFGEEATTATTDSNGAYELSSLPVGSYRVQFGTAAVPTYAPQWWKNKPNFDEATEILVKSGTTTAGRDSVLVLGGTISGLVAGGSPAVGLENVEVTAYDDQQNPISTTETSGAGEFTLRGIPAGSITLGYHETSDPAVFLDEYWNNKTSIDDATYFATTAAGTITGRNATLAVGAVISGVITGDDAPGVPLDGAVVELFDTGHSLVTDAVTGDDGSYRFSALAPGTYKLSFTAPDASGYGSEWWDNAASFSTASTISLAEAATATADAGLVADPEALDEPPMPVIDGVVSVGHTVIVDPGEWGPAPVELAYQWKLYGEPIAGAIGGSYLLTVDDFEGELSVTVTGGKVGYISAESTSEVSVPVGPGTLPTVTPLISGALAVGKTLTVKPGNWAVDDVDLSYRWKNNGTNISGAIDETYKVRSSDAGDKITVTVTGSAYGYSSRAQTSAAAVIGKVFTKTSTPKISGTAKAGKKLTAKAGSWKPSGVSFTYQWKRNGVAISGATKSKYTVLKSDRKKKITVTVTGSKAKYTSVSKTSKAKKVT